MAISAQLVKQLRDKTGAGMMDCKKALTEANGDFEKAIEVLRKKGASVAAKRAERTASEGIVLTNLSSDGSKAIMVEVNCETDFVAKSDDFINFANFVLDVVVKNEPKDIEQLLTLTQDGKNVQDELTTIIGKIGEKIEISRFIIEQAENGIVVDYIHHGSKLGVLVRVDNVTNAKDDLSSFARDMAMQVAAMKPSYVKRDEVSEDVLNKEKEIYKEVARKEGKPEQILDKIADGKLNKFFQENCLLEQASIKDNSKSVGELLKEFNKNNSSEATVKLFHRFHLSDENK
ncbi:MAG: elongation factor Ts [Ignavibacteriales bacterium]|nr:elongation factor Ts [Ignavibacteriales bacterium]MCB9219169.1 elongation factor Ts [Ignavibacteriales bacterium]